MPEMGHPALYQFIEQAAVLAMAGEFEDVEADGQGVWFYFPTGRRVQVAVMEDVTDPLPAFGGMDPAGQMLHLAHHGVSASTWDKPYPLDPTGRGLAHLEGHAHGADHHHQDAPDA